MKFARLTYILLFSILVFTTAKAQQYPIYSQYMMNGFLLNPAIAGHEGYAAINLTVRKQWVGLADAPSTYALSGQTRLLKNSFISRGRSVRKRRKIMSRSGRVGLGGYIFNDQNGAMSKTGFSGTYAYHLTLRRAQLSFGLSLSTFQYRIDRDKIRLEDPDDALLANIKPQAFITDAGFGMYYSDKNLYAGFSISNLFESLLTLYSNEKSEFRLERQYLTMAGYRFDIVDDLYLEPSFLLKISENGIAQIDGNVKCFYREDYWAGLSYRTGSGNRVASETIGGAGSSLIFMLGVRVDKYLLGYAFDYTFSSIGAKTFGSHEIMLAVRFGDTARRYRWLNRY